jgi:hypothetical protein
MMATWPGVRVGIGLVTAEVPPGSGRAPADEYADTLRSAPELSWEAVPVEFDLIGGARS